MASMTLRFTANAATIKIPGLTGGDGVAEFSNSTSHENPIVRTVAQQFATSGTTTGTITVTAV